MLHVGRYAGGGGCPEGRKAAGEVQVRRINVEGMWTVFIGIALGVFEVFLLRKNVEMMSQSKSNIPLGIMITLGKLAVILGVLFIIAKYVSLMSMLWCAGGLAVTMIVLPVIRSVSTIRHYRQQNGGDK